ncbi:MAG: hypothetical protein Q4D44_06660 [Eubacteriales bacterium]|nr:hypothetical protein [Eubacteriales bacterium]
MDKENNKSSKKLIIIIIAVLVIAALTVGGVAVYNGFFAEKPVPSNGVIGKITDGWDTGIEDATASQGSGIQIPGYGSAVMKAGDESIKLSIGNPKANKCGFYATLKLEDGTVLYKSELIKPGYGMTEVPLSKTLEAGEYTAMVCYECVTLDEAETRLNSAESEFTLIVK